YYDRHRSVRLVILVGLAIDQIAQSGLSSLSVIYYSAQLFSWSSNDSAFATAIWMVGGSSNVGGLLVRYIQKLINGTWYNVIE
ncbi:hypothetical protein ACB267_28390, partial [Citrobacter portucalensis]